MDGAPRIDGAPILVYFFFCEEFVDLWLLLPKLMPDDTDFFLKFEI